MNKYFTLILLAVFLNGCATTGTPIDRDKLSLIKEGVTTREEIIELFGRPDEVEYTEERKPVFIYRYFSYRSKVGGFVPYAGWLTSGVDTEEEILRLILNRQNVVEKATFAESVDDINTGIIDTF